MDSITFAENIFLHLRVPPAGLMAEMNSSLQQFLHRYFNCQSSSSGDRCLHAPDRFGVREVRNRTSYCRLLAGREFVPAIQDRTIILALAELEALAGALLPVLFAFLHA